MLSVFTHVVCVVFTRQGRKIDGKKLWLKFYLAIFPVILEKK